MENRLKIFNDLSDIFPSLIPLNGKIPIETDWQYYCENSRLFDKTDFNGHNAGIPGGPANGVIILDIDDRDKFEAWLKKNGHELPLETRMHLTGSGGQHFFYQYPKNGNRYGNRSLKSDGFDIKGVGGQVVAPGSIHPDTGKTYKVAFALPIAPAPQWLLDLALHEEHQSEKMVENLPHAASASEFNIDALPYPIKSLIRNGEEKGRRSEATYSVLNALKRAGASDSEVIQIFETFPIGEKFREKGKARNAWLLKQYSKLETGQKNANTVKDVAARVREYLLEEFDGGIFKISDLKRELGLNDQKYTVARNCVSRMQQQGLIQKHGHQLGCYRVVDKKKNAIEWDAVEAKPSGLILPCGLHNMVVTRKGDMICFAGFKNHNKTAMAIETIRLNIDNFKVYFFITEYKARMKRRLMDFGIDLYHPNFNTYPLDRSDYIPDKIEPGEGVLNVIDHFPNLDNFYLVGKVQDEIHRALDGALSIITHQKKNPDDLDAIGGSFWTITPTLAVTLLPDGDHGHMMKIVKGKEPAEGVYNAFGKTIKFNLTRGCIFGYDENGWK